jgi:hypothetical protein
VTPSQTSQRQETAGCCPRRGPKVAPAIPWKAPEVEECCTLAVMPDLTRLQEAALATYRCPSSHAVSSENPSAEIQGRSKAYSAAVLVAMSHTVSSFVAPQGAFQHVRSFAVDDGSFASGHHSRGREVACQPLGVAFAGTQRSRPLDRPRPRCRPGEDCGTMTPLFTASH